MRIVRQQTILTKKHALFVIFEKWGKIEIVVCCALRVKYACMTCFDYSRRLACKTNALEV